MNFRISIILLALVLAGGVSAADERAKAASAAEAVAKVGADERRLLDLVATLPYTTTYREVKTRFPKLGPMRETTTAGDCRAVLRVRVFELPAMLFFDFRKGVLASCGVSIPASGRAEAGAIYAAARDYLRGRFGEGREMESRAGAGGEGAHSRNCIWSVKGIDFGVHWSRGREYEAGWGAQAATRE